MATIDLQYVMRLEALCDRRKRELDKALEELVEARDEIDVLNKWQALWCKRWEAVWANMYMEYGDNNNWLFSIADEHRMSTGPNVPLWTETRGNPCTGDDAGICCVSCPKYPDDCDASCREAGTNAGGTEMGGEG